MTDLSPRQWNAGDPEPVDRPRIEDSEGDWWTWHADVQRWVSFADPDDPAFNTWHWITTQYGPLTEVLPAKATKAKSGDRVIATQYGRQHETVEGILEAPENPVDEPATVRRDDGIRIYIKDVVEVLPGTDGKITPPWNDRTVAALNAFQNRGDYHPFTCPREHFPDGEMTLVAINDGWVCTAAPACGYTQGWAHSFMVDVPPSQSPQDATNAPSPVSLGGGGATEGVSGELRAERNKLILIEPDVHGVGSLSEAIALALADAYAGIEFEDPTFERGTIAIMTALRERAVQASASQPVHPDWLIDDDHAAERAAHADNWEEQ